MVLSIGELVLGAAVVLWAAALSWIDIRQRRLPNALTVPGAVTILVLAAANGHGRSALLGAAGLFLAYLLVHLAMPAAMGAGDVKLAVATGALTGAFGAPVWIVAALGAPLVTAVVGMLLALGSRAKTVPHGPAMCLASLAPICADWVW